MLLDFGDHGVSRRLVSAGLLVAGATLVLACRPDPPLPPDPDEPTPATSCDEHPALSLTRVSADSISPDPPWLQVCSQCPVAEITFELGDGAGGTLELDSFWTPVRECAVSMATSPLPARPSVPGVVTLRDAENTGTFDFELPIAQERGADPVDLGSATWVLPLAEDTSRIAGGARLFEEPLEALAVHLGVADAEGRRVLTLGAALEAGSAQDLCVPTASLEVRASTVLRQIAAPISQDDLLLGQVLARRGVLQARLTESGDALEDVALLALADLSASELLLEAAPVEACESWAADLGFDPCVPCGPPSDGIAGLPACIPLILEWARAERATWTLADVALEDIPIDCRLLSGGDDDDSAGR